MNLPSPARLLCAALLSFGLVGSSVPAVANTMTPPAPTPVPSAEVPSIPSAPEPSASAEPARIETAPATDVAPPLEGPEEYEHFITDPDNPADAAGSLGARMGQGLERILENNDPQAPTQKEKELLELLDEGSSINDAVAEISGRDELETDLAADGSAGNASVSPGSAATNYWKPAGVLGVDVSSHQGSVNWSAAWANGARFAYVKATEGTYYKNEFYNSQYRGSADQGMLRGAYHFATPGTTSGAEQARYFVANGGGWSADGRTLPPLLDVEYNPYPSLGNTCYGLSHSAMVSWIRDFSNTMRALTGRVPMIYTTTDWWDTCTGRSTAFRDHPLHLARYNNSGPGALPAGWNSYSLWQYTDSGPVVGDWNQWPGDLTKLRAFASNRTLTGLEPTFGAAAARTPGLGAATGPVTCGLHAGGCYQPFAGGNIYYTAATGAHAVTGAYFNAWRNAGWQMKIGYPTSTPICGLHAGGCYQPFTGGNIYYTPATGAHAVTGAYFNAWRNAGWQMKIGYPTSTPICGLHAGGCYQPFTGGNIYYTPATGAHAVTGAYFNAWRNAGWQMEIGYPTSTPICGLHAGGCYQPFTGGNIYYTPATGAHAVTGAYFNAWRNAGWQMKIGYPLAQATTKGGYRTVEFEKARITWTATGTRTTYK